jgi:hypothetical protein
MLPDGDTQSPVVQNGPLGRDRQREKCYFEKLQQDAADPDVRVRFRDWEPPEMGTVGKG